MTAEIRVCQFFQIVTATGAIYRYQNYFVRELKAFAGAAYLFAPFQVDGGISSLNADNEQLRILFPTTEYGIRLERNLNSTVSSLNAAPVPTKYPS